MSRMRGRATYRGVLWLDRIRYCLERPDSKATDSAGAGAMDDSRTRN
jgi:hypothetical protein